MAIGDIRSSQKAGAWHDIFASATRFHSVATHSDWHRTTTAFVKEVSAAVSLPRTRHWSRTPLISTTQSPLLTETTVPSSPAVGDLLCGLGFTGLPRVQRGRRRRSPSSIADVALFPCPTFPRCAHRFVSAETTRYFPCWDFRLTPNEMASAGPARPVNRRAPIEMLVHREHPSSVFIACPLPVG